ncbi:MAG: UDP-4-amino-4,6-dideoxy-N-acetyl-beta-L-altrosamine transaminase [Candidatus Omnitrophota bacterium]
MIPYGKQYIDEEDIKEVLGALRSDWITQGPRVKEFEDALCAFTGAEYAVAVSSGTAALHIAALSAGINEGDEVITSPITFAASANCVLYCGGKSIFADIDSAVVNIDPEEIEKKITPRTKAIIPVHFAGHPCDMEKINTIAKKYGLIVIEDAAHALGAEYKGSKIGSCEYCDMTILSFHPVKHITTGEGGAVLTNDKALYDKLVLFRSHGITKDCPDGDGAWYYEMRALGYNYRITDIQCALGTSQLRKLDGFIKRRKEIAGVYDNAFCDSPVFDIPEETEDVSSSRHLYVIRLRGENQQSRKDIFDELRAKGIGVQVHYVPVHYHPYYRENGYKDVSYPQAESYYASAISLPLYPAMSDDDVRDVVRIVKEVTNKYLR